jgi:hypothetical protein
LYLRLGAVVAREFPIALDLALLTQNTGKDALRFWRAVA